MTPHGNVGDAEADSYTLLMQRVGVPGFGIVGPVAVYADSCLPAGANIATVAGAFQGR